MSSPGRPQSVTLVASDAPLSSAIGFVRQGAAEAGLPASRINELDLVMEEIVMNLTLHAYPDGTAGQIVITYRVPQPGELQVEVADQGEAFDPLAAKAPDLNGSLQDRPIGGLGIFLVKQLANSLSYRREAGWNRLAFGISANS